MGRQIRRTILRNGFKILLILFIASAVCRHILTKHIDQIFDRKITQYHTRSQWIDRTHYITVNQNISSSILSNEELANQLLMIYEQQLSRLTATPFLPTYQNYRLKFKFNITSIVAHLYGSGDSFNGSVRHLRVVCLKRLLNTSAFYEALSFNLSFSVKIIPIKHIQLTLQNDVFATDLVLTSSMPTRNKHIDAINIAVNRSFSPDVVFSFTYQWTDLEAINSFDWPQWPLQKLCVDSIERNIRQNGRNDFKLDLPCLVTNTLTHSTARQVFLAEQSAVLHWLDKQYEATVAHSLLSKPKTRRSSPMELSRNSTICSPEFSKWISTYQQWHENITATIIHSPMTFEQQRDRIFELNIRFMLYETPNSGTADRIVHLMTTYLIAILTKRVFLFDSKWPKFVDIMQSTLNYEQTSIIPWFSHLHVLNANLSSNDSKYFTFSSHATSFHNIDEHYNYDREFPERILIFQGHMGRIVQMMTSNSSIYRRFLTDDLHMNAENMFGCLYHSLLIHRLAGLVQRTSGTINISSPRKNLGHSPQQILRAMLSPTFFPIGIQVRTEDDSRNYDLSNRSQAAAREEDVTVLFQHYIYCAQDLVIQNQEILNTSGQVPFAFLLSNAAGIRQTFLKRWQLPPSCLHSFQQECYNRSNELFLLANSDSVYHVAHTPRNVLALQLALFDIFLFSFCELHIITAASGFGRIAVFAALRGRNIYSLSRDDRLFCRNDSESTALIDSGYAWSGI